MLALLFALFLAAGGDPSIAELRAAAAKGDAEAQAHLSWAYHTGFGVALDDAEGVRSAQLAAKQGQASAEYYLGSDYEFGLGGLPKDSAQAAVWYRRGGAESPDRRGAARRFVCSRRGSAAE